jgi:hypothetical protein
MIKNLSAEMSEVANGNGRGSAAAIKLGDRVRSGRFGSGSVRAFNPDGSVIVRFDGCRKSRRIFPSLLQKTV